MYVVTNTSVSGFKIKVALFPFIMTDFLPYSSTLTFSVFSGFFIASMISSAATSLNLILSFTCSDTFFIEYSFPFTPVNLLSFIMSISFGSVHFLLCTFCFFAMVEHRGIRSLGSASLPSCARPGRARTMTVHRTVMPVRVRPPYESSHWN